MGVIVYYCADDKPHNSEARDMVMVDGMIIAIGLSSTR